MRTRATLSMCEGVTFLAAALLALTAAQSDEGGGRLLANKCCSASEQVHTSLTTCVPYDSAPAASSATEEKAGAVRVRQGESRFPWWMYQKTTLHDPASLGPLGGDSSFLGNATPDSVLRYGHRPCSFDETQYVFGTSLDKYKLLANGTLILNVWKTNGSSEDREQTQVALPPEEWCSDRITNGNFVLLTCPCARVTCVLRCCSKSTMFVTEKKRKKISGVCSKVANATAHLIAPQFFSGHHPLSVRNVSETHVVQEEEPIVYTELVSHSPVCNSTHAKYLLNSSPDVDPLRFWIQRNGSVLIEDYGHGQPFPPLQFCMTRVLKDDETIGSDIVFCHKRSTSEAPRQENIYYSLLFLSGAFFLLLTLLVHAVVPELRRSAHAKALMCHCGTLCISSIALTVGHLQRRFAEPYCSISAFIVQFFFLSTFFWLNVMCFDLSWTFGALRRRISSNDGQMKRFLYYSLYAWGCPAVITALTLFMEYATVVPPDFPLLPNIGARRCWFDTKWATFVYYYAPMGLLLVVNLGLFAFTVWRIRYARRGTSILRKGSANARTAGGASSSTSVSTNASTTRINGSRKSEQEAAGAGTAPGGGDAKSGDRQMLRVFVKLFCLMGVTWVTEIISWLTGDDSFAFWYLTDAINLLRGVLIFVLFCCKPAALRPLRARLRGWFPWAKSCCARSEPEVSVTQGASSSTQDSVLSLQDMAGNGRNGSETRQSQAQVSHVQDDAV